jgi:RsiW-degrading membrane proteinase PrsW (M82 family)
VFASGLVLGPLVILVLELLLLIFIGVLAILWVMVNPSLANQLNSLIIRIQNGGSNTEAIARALVPLIFNPGILFLGFAYMSVLVPLLEEALKPIGVWLLAGQKITPAQGFGYGVLSGAGFGLFENLGNTSSGVANWALLASTRVSTLLLHSFTAGLVGWALVSAWSERRYLRLAITYAIAVTLHGLWNGLALVSMAPQLEDLTNISLPVNLQQAGTFSTYGIVALGVVVILLYFAANAYFRATIPTVTSAFPAGDHTSPDAYTSSQKVLPADQASQNDVHKTNLEASTPTVPPADLGDPPNRPDHDQNL